METVTIKVEEEFKTEIKNLKEEPCDATNPPGIERTSPQETKPVVIKLEPHEAVLEGQEVTHGVVHVKSETLVDPPIIKTETQDCRIENNEVQEIKSETNESKGLLLVVKSEPQGDITEDVSSASGLVIESTSSLSADVSTGNKTSLYVNAALGSSLQVKEEVLSVVIKEEKVEIKEDKVENNLPKIKSEGVVAFIAHDSDVDSNTSNFRKSRRTCKRIDYSVFGDCGNDDHEPSDIVLKKTRNKSVKQPTRQNVMWLNPKWKAKTESNAIGPVADVVNSAKHVKNILVKSKQPSCKKMKGPIEGSLSGQETDIFDEAPTVWINIKKEKEEDEEIENVTNSNNADAGESAQMDWQFNDINNGLDLVRNLNKMFSESVKTEVNVLDPPKVLRGRRKMRKMKAVEFANLLLDERALSVEQTKLITDLRTRMDFSDSATLSYWDGFKFHLCLVCAYKTHVPANMVKHIRCHTGEKPYACEECDYRSAESSSMATHMRTHTGEKPYACPHCDFRTAGSSVLKTHIMIHTGKKPYSCPHCDFKCREHGGLKRHIRTHTGEKPFACPHCDYRGPSSTCLKSHLMVHTKAKPHVCGFCGYATACSSSLTIHLRRHTGEKPYSCSVCSHKFVSSGTLKVHMRTHTGEKPYSCKICDYRSATQGRFKAHLRIHSGDKKHECPFCDYKSVRSDNLKIHLRTHTGERPYPCPHCEYRSSEKARLIQHIRVHTGEKPFVCNICGFRTADSTGLRSHAQVHSSDRPYCCSYCDFKTTRRGILKNHIMRHTGVKPYACPYCPYKCTKSCSLKGHVANNHTGNKKFACDVKGCNYRAVFASLLKLHMRKHMKSRPFKCGLCPYKGKHETYLKDHIKRNHSSDQANSKYSCYSCLFYTSSRQKMKSHARKHLKLPT